MFVVTVTFVVKPEHLEAFEGVMKRQATNSLRYEVGCRQFDVCQDRTDRCRIFLYEVYDDAEAFAAHLRTDHFATFDKTVKNWVVSKAAEQWQRFPAEA